MKAVLFDLDDTLYDVEEPFARAFAQRFGSTEAPVKGVLKAHRRYSDEVFEASQSGAITMEEMYIYRMQRAMEDFGIRISAEEALAFQREYAQNQRWITLDAGMGRVLQFCRESGLSIGLVTNGGSAHQWKKIMPKENIFISGEVGLAKPDPEIYRFARKRLGLQTRELVYVGDTYKNDVAAAKQAGWKAVWYNRREHALPEGEPLPDGIVKNADELLAYIKEQRRIETEEDAYVL